MQRYLLIILFLAVTSGCLSISDNQRDVFIHSGQQELSLNGIWSFSTDSTLLTTDNWLATKFNTKDWDALNVPGNWDTENDYANYVGTGIYRKNFRIPKNWSESTVRIHFEAVYQKARVWFNGQYLGEHIGGYTPFEFDISKLIRAGKTNTIALTADNTYGRGAWWHWGGISRDVTLIRTNHTFIKQIHVTTAPDFNNGHATIYTNVKIENTSDDQVSGTILAEIEKLRNDQHASIKYEIPFNIQEKETAYFLLSRDMKPEEVELWDVENPVLYKMNITLLTDDGRVIHNLSDRFGIREIKTEGTKVLLNGKEIYLNGFNRISDHRAFGQTEPDELVKFDIDAMKAMGSNLTRIMHYPQSTNLLNYCDEIGMLLIQEIPVWGREDPQLFPDNPLTKKWLEDMINRDYNHPSVIGWSVGNEIADSTLEGRQMSPRIYGYVETMIDHVKTLDTTRLTTYVSFTAGNAGKVGVDPADICDIICFTSYGGAHRVAERIHTVWPDKPIFVAEIGASQFSLQPDEAVLPQSLINSIHHLKELDYVVGASLWTYNDYRSKYRGTPPGQNRTWGVYNVWRQPKKAAYQIQELFTNGVANTDLPAMAPPPDNFCDSTPVILAIIPLENSCMVGFTVENDEDNYEIEYTNHRGRTKTIEISGLSGAAKIYDLSKGEYMIRMRRINSDGKSDWSAPRSVTIK